MHIFQDRTDAGRQLAEKLTAYASPRTLVLALPRGGVPVGYEVAQKLGAPLDTIVVRKIGAPHNPEFGVGAIAPGGIAIFDETSLASLNLTREDLAPIIEREQAEMERRIAYYHNGARHEDTPPPDTIIIVDDGLATGVTARAAIASVRRIWKPQKIIFAVPVCSRDVADPLRGLVDEVICVTAVDELSAISMWYDDFRQVTDEEVVRLIQESRR